MRTRPNRLTSILGLIRDTFQAARITSHAFGKGTAGAAVIFLAQLLSVVSAGSRHVHLTSNRLGVLVLLRNRPVRTLLRLGLFLAALCVPALLSLAVRYLQLGSAWVQMAGFGISALLMFWLAAGMATMARQGQVALDVRGLPVGELYILSSLAQMPGSSSGVLADLRSAILELPSESAVAAIAADETMATRYEKLGFTRGSKLQVFLQR